MADSSLAELEERLVGARIQLAMNQPFLASAVMRLPMRGAGRSDWCPTMCTDGYHIFYNSQWTATLSQHELCGVIAHEVLHVVFAHGERQQDREARRWNIACDHAINLLLMSQGFKLPIGGVADRRYREMPSEEIYDELPPNAEFRIFVRGATEAGGARGEGEDGDAEEIFRSTSNRPTDNDEAAVDPGVLVSVGVDLISPNDPRVKALADPNAPDREQLDALRKSLRTESISRLPGTASAAFQQECLASDQSRIDWRELLRCWLYDRILSDWRSFPFSRKHLVRGLYMPSIGVEAPGHIVFAIDTSGSMTDKMLAGIVGELRAFRETFPCRLTMIQCDESIQEIQEFESMDGTEIPKLLSIKGRGGTAFGPVFDWVAANAQGVNPPVLIYATDGYGSFWKRTPEWPVIWLLTDGDVAVPHGKTVRV